MTKYLVMLATEVVEFTNKLRKTSTVDPADVEAIRCLAFSASLRMPDTQNLARTPLVLSLTRIYASSIKWLADYDSGDLTADSIDLLFGSVDSELATIKPSLLPHVEFTEYDAADLVYDIHALIWRMRERE